MNFKSKFFILLVILSVIFTITCVSAEANQSEILCDDVDFHSFEELNQSISQSNGELNLTQDYKYDSGEILIEKDDKFVLNGNNHIIEGVSNCQVFDIESKEDVIFNNLTFRNCYNVTFMVSGPFILNNVKFINCSSMDYNHLLFAVHKLTINNCVFHITKANYGVIYNNAPLIINNSLFTGNISGRIISTQRDTLIIENSSFENISSNLTNLINYKGSNLIIKKSKFLNLHAPLSGAVIIGKFFPNIGKDNLNPFLIENCQFINCTSTNDGGAIYFDLDSGSENIKKGFNIIKSNFTNCISRFGGAIAIQGGIINIIESNFINNSADFEGGAIFTTWSNLNISNSNFINNSAVKNAGAIYFDKGKLTINQSYLLNNNVFKESVDVANCIYAHDVKAYFTNSTFDNGGIGVYADFADNSKLENINKNDDIFIMDNKNYIVSVESNGIKLNLTKNESVIDVLPSRYDLRDFGWVTPIKRQGDNDDCWAFATASSLESSLLKATGVVYNLSQNYVQKLQLKYYPIGDLRNSLTGFAYSGLGYALSWYGALPLDSAYDDRGMISDTDLDDARIHLQDAMIIFGHQDDTSDLIKQAIMKYGPVSVQLTSGYPVENLNTTGEDIAIMNHDIHFISIIGWDDNYCLGDYVGAWIVL